jgi:hypothetical protein
MQFTVQLPMPKGNPGIPKSPEHRAKISAAQKGVKRHPLTPEHKAALSAAKKGKMTPEQRAVRAAISVRVWKSRPRKVMVSYSSMHRRIRKRKGSATKYACVGCGESAREWSLILSTSENRIIRDQNGQYPYSLNVNDYEPRCVSCHRKHDRRQKGLVNG